MWGSTEFLLLWDMPRGIDVATDRSSTGVPEVLGKLCLSELCVVASPYTIMFCLFVGVVEGDVSLVECLFEQDSLSTWKFLE